MMCLPNEVFLGEILKWLDIFAYNALRSTCRGLRHLLPVRDHAYYRRLGLTVTRSRSFDDDRCISFEFRDEDGNLHREDGPALMKTLKFHTLCEFREYNLPMSHCTDQLVVQHAWFYRHKKRNLYASHCESFYAYDTGRCNRMHLFKRSYDHADTLVADGKHPRTQIWKLPRCMTFSGGRTVSHAEGYLYRRVFSKKTDHRRVTTRLTLNAAGVVVEESTLTIDLHVVSGPGTHTQTVKTFYADGELNEYVTYVNGRVVSREYGSRRQATHGKKRKRRGKW
jgi:hypothetical protein